MAELGTRSPKYGEVGQDTVRQAARNRIQRTNQSLARGGRAFGPEPGRSNNYAAGTPGNRVARQFQGRPRA